MSTTLTGSPPSTLMSAARTTSKPEVTSTTATPLADLLTASTSSGQTATASTLSNSISTRTTPTTLSTRAILESTTISLENTAPIQWGPAITADPYLSSAAVDSEISNRPSRHYKGLSFREKQGVIAATVLGGTIILALIVLAICRKRRGVTVSEILCCRRRKRESDVFVTSGEKSPSLPIYKHFRFSVHSSRHPAMTSPTPDGMRSPVPATVATRFHAQNPYIKHQWKTADPVEVPGPRQGSFLFDATPPGTPAKGSTSSKAHVTVRRLSQNPLLRKESDLSLRSDVQPYKTRTTDIETNTLPIPNSPTEQDNEARWSWTNADAPATPKVRAHNRRSSIASSTASRFRSLTSWANGQKQRVREQQASAKPKKPVLKNQASKPTLAPRKVSKSLSKKQPPPRIESGSSRADIMPSTANAGSMLSPVEMKKISR